jgi:transposase InsO family protein
MKIPMGCCGSTFQKGQILAVTRQQSWMQLHIRSTQDLGKHSAGKLPLKFSTDSLQCSMTKVLRRSVESAQYLSIKYTERLAEAGIEPSVGSVGDSYDNALAETINGLYKAEVIHRRGPWRSFEVVEFATLEWVDWFNNRRLLEPIGNIPPAEAEQNYYAAMDNVPMAA